MERELYVYFLKDEDYLKNIVENLENQSKIKTIGLEDWKLPKMKSSLRVLYIFRRRIQIINIMNIKKKKSSTKKKKLVKGDKKWQEG